MKNIKVEINGVNTAELPVYSSSEQMRILREIKKRKNRIKRRVYKCKLKTCFKYC